MKKEDGKMTIKRIQNKNSSIFTKTQKKYTKEIKQNENVIKLMTSLSKQ